jgi:DNA invertase Pin-like site-specific DNA recombinase
MKTAIKCKLVAYYRVSTDGQGKSKLGLEAQQHLIESYARMTGCTVVAVYTEVESGKVNARPELARALAHAKRHNARLVIAKLDRLGRKVHFISGLMETGVDFVAADSPHDDRFVLHMKASMAEEEGRKISERTKDALAALKARGVTLGRPENMSQDAREKGASVNRDAAITAYATLMPMIRQLRADGLSFAAIATRLNEEGRSTRNGAAWTSMAVKRVLDRA